MKTNNLLNLVGQESYTQTRRGRFSHDSIVSRFSLVSLICALVLTLNVTNAWGTDFTLTSASSVTQDGITVSFAKGDGANAPAWYAAGLRLYAKNTVTISVSTGNIITGVSFNWEKQGSKDFASVSASTGSYTHPSNTGVGTWSGSASSITFTLGASGQLQLNTFSVTKSSGGGCTDAINISKGSTSNGTFTLDKTGAQSTCSSAVTVTVTTSPSAGYYVSDVTAPNSSTIVDNGDGTWTVTYDQNTNASSQINVTFSAIPPSETYELVTDASQLAVGNEIIILNTSGGKAMSTTQNDKNRGTTTNFTLTGTTVTVPGLSDVQVLTLGQSNSKWTLSTGSGYLYAGSSSENILRTQSPNDANGEWTITINGTYQATITAQGSNTHNILQNNSAIFSCYTGGQTAIKIYKKGASVKHTVTWDASGTTQTTQVNEGSKPTFPSTPASCDDVSTEFYGWATSTWNGTVDDLGGKTVYTSAGDMPSVMGDVTYYAVWCHSNNAWMQVETLAGITEGTYVIENGGYALPSTNTGSTNPPAKSDTYLLTISGKEITSTVTSDMQWLFTTSDSKFFIKNADGDYLYATSANNGLRVNTTSDTWSFAANTSAPDFSMQETNNSRYCAAYNGGTDWRSYTSAAHTNYENGGKIHLYKYGGGTKDSYRTTCCAVSAPNVVVTAHSTSAILSWESQANATGYRISVPAKGISNQVLAANVTSYTLTGLTMTTEYAYSVTAIASDCEKTTESTFKTTGPDIDIVEWLEDGAVLYIDDAGLNPKVVIDGEVEHGTSASVATELFFAKYFEGAGNMKLLSIYNGTRNAIDLSTYKIYLKCVGNTSNTFSPGDDKEYPLAALGNIEAGQEIIFYTPAGAGESPASCSSTFLSGKENLDGPENNPRWIRCGGGYEHNGTTYDVLNFSGNDPLLLYKGSTIIDIFGAKDEEPSESNCRGEDAWLGSVKNIDYGKSTSDPSFTELFEASSKNPVSHADSVNILNAFGINLTEQNINISTARCILFRAKVPNGQDAADQNDDDFVTFTPTEWNGRSVCMTNDNQTAAGVSNDGEATCNSYQELGKFDYGGYYTEYENIEPGTDLSEYTHNDRNEYTIDIPNMSQYACLGLRFQLTKNGEVVTETVTQVPIVVADNVSTNNALFNEIVKDGSTPNKAESIERCKTCNVVILSNQTLTKAADNASDDVAEVQNLKIYPGGKLVVPASTNYKVSSLALRRQEDAVAMADIKGNITIGKTNGVYLDLRIDPSNWHYISLPYDCNVDEVTFSDGATATLGEDWLCARYDGEYRAANKDGGWTDVTSGSTLSKGLGYIVSLPGSGNIRKELRFPMANGVIADEKTNKTVSYVRAWGGDKTDEELTPNHKGWNLIGNPYMMYYESDLDKTPLKMGTLERDPENTNTYLLNTTGSKNVRYLVEPISNGWSGYRQISIGTHMPPFTSYFIQVGGTTTAENNPATERSIQFDVDQSGRSSIVRRRDIVTETEDNHPIWYGIEMVAPNGEKDNTALLISDDFTDEYDMMDDLVKMRGSYYQYYNLPVLATRNSKEELAFNALPDNSAAVTGVPVNFYAAQAGEYTISTDGRYDLGEVKEAKLFDATTNQYYDLLADNYTFTASKGNNTERFRLFVTVERNKVPTDTDLPTLADVALTTIGNTLVLSGLSEASDIYVYDMSGKLMQNAHANGNGEIWRTHVPATGVYFVRVNTANGQQTLRAVVK